MAEQNKPILQGQAIQIRDEVVDYANTATRVGTHLLDMVDSKASIKTGSGLTYDPTNDWFVLKGTLTEAAIIDAAGHATSITGGDVTLANSSFRLQIGTGLVLTDLRGTPVGIEYAADYSANYGNRSIPDWEAVTDAIANVSFDVGDLGDVDLTGLTDGQILSWNLSKWVPIDPPTGGGGSSLWTADGNNIFYQTGNVEIRDGKEFKIFDSGTTDAWSFSVDSNDNLIVSGPVNGNTHFSGDVIAFSDLTPPPGSWWDLMPIASASVLGGVKIGSGITVQPDGTISVSTGVSTWDALTDTPATKVANKWIKVNAGASALEYVDAPSGATWGSITGTLSDQTDLQNELDGKLNLSGGTLTDRLIINRTGDGLRLSYGASESGFIKGLKDSANHWYLGAGDGASDNISLWNYKAGGVGFGTNGSTRMFINSSGNVGIGTSSPSSSFKLHVYDNGACALFERNAATGSVARFKTTSGLVQFEANSGYTTKQYLNSQNAAGTAYQAFGIKTAGGDPQFVFNTDGSFTATGEIEAFDSSDKRLKENIITLDSTAELNKVKALRPVKYYHKKHKKEEKGLIAQEVKEVFPEIVKTDDKDMLLLQYQKLVPSLIASIQNLEKRIRQLEHGSRK